MLKIISICVLLVISVVACVSSDSGEPPESSGTSHSDDPWATETATRGSATADDQSDAGAPALWKAQTLEELISWYPNVIVGTVQGPAEVEFDESTIGGLTSVFPVYNFPVVVDQVIYSQDAAFPADITFAQGDLPGWHGANLPSVGERYIFFLADLSQFYSTEDYFTGPFFARFLIDDQGRVVPTGWEHAPGVAAVSGVDANAIQAAYLEAEREQALLSLAKRTVDEAAAIILEASKHATPKPPRTPMATQTPVVTVAATATDAPAASETPVPSPSAAPTAAAAP